jgi:hypothetical protein
MDTTVGDDDGHVNPILPTSVGALLAEEWIINPQSTLLSFLELMMVEEAEKSGWKSMEGGIDFLRKSLLSMADGDGLRERPTSNARWKELLRRIARLLSNKLLEPYKYELVFLASFFVEYRAITSSTSAMFWEGLYGGKRVKLGAEQEKQQGPNGSSQRVRALIPMKKSESIVFVILNLFEVYLIQRCDDLLHRLKEVQLTAYTDWERKFLNLYPYFRKFLIGIHFFFQFRYMIGRSVFFDPYSQAMGLVLRRVTQADQQAPTRAVTDEEENNNGQPFKPHSLVSQAPSKAESAKRKVAFWLLSAAAIRLLARIRRIRVDHVVGRDALSSPQTRPMSNERTQTSPQSAFEKIASKESLHPPPPLPAQGQSKLLLTMAQRSPEKCPLCRQPRVNPTASTGGYVFCLKCLSNYVNERGKCPVTGKDCPPSRIVPLFEPHRS